MNYFFRFLARISEKMWGSSPSGPGARATQFLDDYYSGNGQQSTDHGHQRWDICHHSEIHHKMCLISTLLTTSGFLSSKLFNSANFQPNQKRRPRPRLLGCLRPLHLDAEHLCWHWKQQSLLWLLQQILKWNQLRQCEYIPFFTFLSPTHRVNICPTRQQLLSFINNNKQTGIWPRHPLHQRVLYCELDFLWRWGWFFSRHQRLEGSVQSTGFFTGGEVSKWLQRVSV